MLYYELFVTMKVQLEWRPRALSPLCPDLSACTSSWYAQCLKYQLEHTPLAG